jgi:predicted MFS family arabinose efflux permease
MVSNPAVEEGRAEAAVVTPVVAPPDESLFTSLVRYPQFRFLWSASLSTQLGQWFQNVALGWLALELTNSAGFVGKIGFASGVPILLLSLPAGVLLDRIDRRRALMVCQVVGAVLALAVALVNWRGLIEPWHLVLAAILSGALLAISQPATQTLVPALVPRHDLPNALALTSAGNSSTRIVGPSIAGLLIGVVGLAGCFVAQSVALFGAAALTMRLRLPKGARAGAAIGGGLIEGLRLIGRDRTLTGLLLLGAAPALFAYPYVQMLPVFVRDVYHLDARGLGLIMAVSGVGGLSGSLFVAKLNNYPNKGRMTVYIGVIYGFALLAFTLSPWPILSAVLLAASSFLGSAFYSGNQILVQIHVSEAIRGRVMGALALSFGLTPVGSLLIGELAQFYGAPLGVALGALCSSFLVALIGWRYREILNL